MKNIENLRNWLLHMRYKMPLVYGSYYLWGVMSGIRKDCPEGFEMILSNEINGWETRDFPVIKKANKTFYYRFKVTRRANIYNGDYAPGDPGVWADLIFSRVKNEKY